MNRNDSGRFAVRSVFSIGTQSRYSVWVVLSLLLGGLFGSPARGQLPEDSNAVVKAPAIDEILVEALSASEIPGAVAAIARVDQPIRIGCVGLRHFNKKEPLTIHDRMHIGSCTKAMTATLIGRLVDQGRLDWDSTLAECLPDLATEIHPDYRPVTIQQLLMHRSGMPAQAVNWWNSRGRTVAEKRRSIAIESLAHPPEKAPGTEYHYSNLGYMVAGLMAAHQAESTWEELMQQELFDPLEMKTAGFGSPGPRGSLDHPWGHRSLPEGLMAVQSDNAPALGPAGTVHCSMSDWAQFAKVHMDSRHPLITESTRQHLHAISQELKSAGQKYALGWVVSRRRWSAGPVLSHSGSNTLWYCKIFIATNEREAYMVAANIANPETPQELDRIVKKLIALEAGQRSE